MLFPYQKVGAEWLAARSVGMLADEMGVGKTPQAIVACDLAGVDTAVVVCPGIARVNWKREFEAWQTRPRVVEVVNASADLSTTRLMLADVIVISYSMLSQKHVRAWFKNAKYGALILDEGHALKEPSSTRSRAVYGHKFDRASGLAKGAKHVWVLTGTPMPNGPQELWTHARALWPEALDAAGVKRRSMFIEHFCATDDTGRIVGARRPEQFKEIMRPYVLRRRQADVQPDLPPLRWSQVSVRPDSLPPMPPDVAEAAAVVAAAMAKASGDDDKLKQLAAESMHLATLRRWTGVAKAEAVAELIRADLDGGMGSCVVFAIHRAVMETLRANIPGAHVLFGDTGPDVRQVMIDTFQAGKFPVFICQLSIAATALTLTKASNVIFAESSWTPADMLQAAKRCHRIGQKSAVLARVISLAGSVDDSVSAVLVRKNSLLAKIDLAE